VNVLHLTSGNLYGGIETYLLTLARLRHLCPGMVPRFGLCFPGRIRDELHGTGCPVHDLGPVRTSRPWTVLRARRRLERVLGAGRFDAAITHGTWPHAVFAPVVKRAGVRLVNAIHGELTGKNWIDRWAARTPPDAVVSNSRFTASSAASTFPGVPVQPVYLPVANNAENRDEARREIRRELGTPADTVVILQASRLERWKGQAILIEALGRLKGMPGWCSWIAGGAQKGGEAAFLDELKRLAERMGVADRVLFLGQRSDVPKLMAAADVYCQPNTGPEPFGIAFVEALYAGLPVVSSAFGGALEIVDDSCGILCPPGDKDAVGQALGNLIENPLRRSAMSSSGPARAGRLCDPGRQLSELAQSLLGVSRASQ
jgi:glycosyltransferase involved in cell wall biosynthesis